MAGTLALGPRLAFKLNAFALARVLPSLPGPCRKCDASANRCLLLAYRDELSAAWRIFTPILHAIDRGELTPLKYQAGAATSAL